MNDRPESGAVKEILGHVDGFIGSYLNGWAVATADDHCCTVEVCDENGVLIGSGRANRHREDLVSLNFARTDLGFYFPLEAFGSGKLVHVLVDGIELAGSPIRIGVGVIDGFFTVVQGLAVGWVSHRHDGAGATEVSIRLLDGTEVGHTTATPDTTGQDPFFRPCRFEVPLDPICFGREEFILEACSDGLPFARAPGGLPLDGYMDAITPDYCSGWLLCPVAPSNRLVVTAWRDGRLVGSAPCDEPRLDLKLKYPESWRCGFTIRFDLPDTELAALSELSLRLERSPIELLGGPFYTGRRVSFIAVAKQVAGLAHRAEAFLTNADRALFQNIMLNYLSAQRQGDDYAWIRNFASGAEAPARPINIVIPIYRGIGLTEACIRSVLASCRPGDRVVLVADSPPESEMNAMLERFRKTDNIVLLRNKTNLGFIGAVNRGLDFCTEGDVLLLNSDTLLFAGGLDELRTVLHSESDIATVTALSNNATIFSYPHPSLPTETLEDVSWEDLARVALLRNKGVCIDVPTGHGFCMLVRREVLDRLGRLNVSFGRGYGEENELCLRATDLGFRHVAAAGVFVEHRESVSFGDEKAGLITANLAQLETMFPEYTSTIMTFERTDALRTSRWGLDAYRLEKTRETGLRFVLIVENWLGGGTGKAVDDIGKLAGYGNRLEMRLSSTRDGLILLSCNDLRLKIAFAEDEQDELIKLLDAANIDLVLFHQLLGFNEVVIRSLGHWSGSRKAICYVHDFYTICPRTTLINAVGQYCGAAEADVCSRCVKLGGAHEASRLLNLTPAMHRTLFREFLGNMSQIVAPSSSTADLLRSIFPNLTVRAIPHPTKGNPFPDLARPGNPANIVLLGGIGPHKGSHKLLEIASQALLTYAHLTFTVVGHTDIDTELKKLGNVRILGRYDQADLPSILNRLGSSVALFLSCWPETFSYTLSEAVEAGLLPVVPDIGAQAERVRNAGFGIVFPFPINATEVLHVLDSLTATDVGSGRPGNFYTPQSIPELSVMLN